MIEEGDSDLDLESIETHLGSMEYLPVNLLKAAEILGVNIVSSSPFRSGLVLQQKLPRDVFKCMNNSARHLLFLQSIPSSALVTTLVGMKSPGNVEKNLEYLYHDKLSEEEFDEYVSGVEVPEEDQGPAQPNPNQNQQTPPPPPT